MSFQELPPPPPRPAHAASQDFTQEPTAITSRPLEELPPAPFVPEQMSRRSAVVSAARRAGAAIAGKLFRRGRETEPDVMLPEPVAVSGLLRSPAGLAGESPLPSPDQQEVSRSKPESKLRGMLQEMLNPDSIQKHRDRILSELDVEKQRSVGQGTKSRKSYQLENELDWTRTEPYASLMLEKNNPEAIELRHMLDESPRIQRGQWSELPGAGQIRERIHLYSKPGESIAVPVSNIVHAGGFLSWQGRGAHGEGGKINEHTGVKQTSAETIAEYAALDTPVPPIDDVVALVQPNGLVVYIAENGAHRTAAALMRGDTTIQAKNLVIKQYDRNIFELPKEG